MIWITELSFHCDQKYDQMCKWDADGNVKGIFQDALIISPQMNSQHVLQQHVDMLY